MKFGPLDSFSCFKFENTLGSLKGLVSSTKAPLKSFGNNMRNKSTFVSKASRNFMNFHEIPALKCPILGDLVAAQKGGEAYKTVYYKNVSLCITKPDCFFATSRTAIYRCKNIIQNPDGSVSLIARKFDKLTTAYYIPTDAHRFNSSELGVYRLLNLSNAETMLDLEKDFKYKCVVHTFDDKVYCYPLLSLI
jgi:hypothetical protein